MYCTRCGTPNDDNAFRCVRCGAMMRPVQPHASDEAAMRMLLPVGRTGLSIAAGYAGLFALLIFPAPIALILGILAIDDIRKHPNKHGMGRAVFGAVAGALGTLALIAIILF